MFKIKRPKYTIGCILLGMGFAFGLSGMTIELYHRFSTPSPVIRVLQKYDTNKDGDINSKNGELSNLLRDYRPLD